MADLTITRLRHQLHLPDDAQRAPALELAHALPQALADALDQRGLAPSAVVCIRRVSTTVRVSPGALRAVDATMTRWADGVAAAIERDCAAAARHGGGGEEDVLWFRDRGAVLGDVLARAPRGELARRWAWTAAGVVRAGDPADPAGLVAAVLRRHPQHAAAAVRTLLTAAPELVRAWAWPTWVELAGTVAAPARAGATVDARRVEQRRRRLAATAGVTAIVAIARAAWLRAGGSSGTAVNPAAGAAGSSMAGGSELARVARAVVALGAPELLADPAAQLAVEALWVDGSAATGGAQPLVGVEASTGSGTAPPATTVDSPGDTGATTFVGGLLYLHNVIGPLDLPARLTDPDHPLGGRPLVETLVALAVALTGSSPADPGVLAFVGRAPADSIGVAELQLADAEQSAIAQVVAEIDAALLAALPGLAACHGPALRGVVVRRSARIEADPGWIEATFAADDADIDIRRAGLDVDPGFLPYLGCVLRFRYV